MFLFSCSFDYGNQDSGDKKLPDIVMKNVEYVRVRSADPQLRFLAEKIERYEDIRMMDVVNLSFEQFENSGEDVNAHGRAGTASIEIDTGNIRMDDSVRIQVNQEDIAIETLWLEWKDKERLLLSGEEEEVSVFQENGTSFTGIGFKANARERNWSFTGAVNGSYVHEDKDEEEKEKTNENEAVSSSEKEASE